MRCVALGKRSEKDPSNDRVKDLTNQLIVRDAQEKLRNSVIYAFKGGCLQINLKRVAQQQTISWHRSVRSVKRVEVRKLPILQPNKNSVSFTMQTQNWVRNYCSIFCRYILLYLNTRLNISNAVADDHQRMCQFHNTSFVWTVAGRWQRPGWENGDLIN